MNYKEPKAEIVELELLDILCAGSGEELEPKTDIPEEEIVDD